MTTIHLNRVDHIGIDALVAGALVTVRIRRPAHGRPRLPRWTCSVCDVNGREACWHIAALAALRPTPAQLDRIRNPQPRVEVQR